MKLQPWKDDASCFDEDGRYHDLFFPTAYEGKWERARREDRAARICADCPVRQECYDYAVRFKVNEGVWAGIPGDDIQRIRRRKRQGVVEPAGATK